MGWSTIRLFACFEESEGGGVGFRCGYQVTGSSMSDSPQTRNLVLHKTTIPYPRTTTTVVYGTEMPMNGIS